MGRFVWLIPITDKTVACQIVASCILCAIGSVIEKTVEYKEINKRKTTVVGSIGDIGV